MALRVTPLNSSFRLKIPVTIKSQTLDQCRLLQGIDFVNRSEFVKILLYASKRSRLEKAAQIEQAGEI